MNAVVTRNMVAGEESDVTSNHLGMKSTVIDSSLLSLNEVGLSIGAAKAVVNGLLL